jgi:hypothetical protein
LGQNVYFVVVSETKIRIILFRNVFNVSTIKYTHTREACLWEGWDIDL